jgi:hypothetical protein
VRNFPPKPPPGCKWSNEVKELSAGWNEGRQSRKSNKNSSGALREDLLKFIRGQQNTNKPDLKDKPKASTPKQNNNKLELKRAPATPDKISSGEIEKERWSPGRENMTPATKEKIASGETEREFGSSLIDAVLELVSISLGMNRSDLEKKINGSFLASLLSTGFLAIPLVNWQLLLAYKQPIENWAFSLVSWSIFLKTGWRLIL